MRRGPSGIQLVPHGVHSCRRARYASLWPTRRSHLHLVLLSPVPRTSGDHSREMEEVCVRVTRVCNILRKGLGRATTVPQTASNRIPSAQSKDLSLFPPALPQRTNFIIISLSLCFCFWYPCRILYNTHWSQQAIRENSSTTNKWLQVSEYICSIIYIVYRRLGLQSPTLTPLQPQGCDLRNLFVM